MGTGVLYSPFPSPCPNSNREICWRSPPPPEEAVLSRSAGLDTRAVLDSPRAVRLDACLAWRASPLCGYAGWTPAAPQIHPCRRRRWRSTPDFAGCAESLPGSSWGALPHTASRRRDPYSFLKEHCTASAFPPGKPGVERPLGRAHDAGRPCTVMIAWGRSSPCSCWGRSITSKVVELDAPPS